MGNERVSRKDVAELAGVTETIVSYVLNNNRAVKKEKREAVLDAVKKLNYKPNKFARALHGMKTRHIMLLIDRIHSEAFGTLISEIEHFSNSKGFLCSISIISNTDEFVDKIIDWDVDGVIISSISFDISYIQRLIDSHLAVVLLENREYSGITEAFKINTGLYEGIQKSVSYMYDTGCRSIIYADRISANGHFGSPADFRYASYCDAVRKLGLKERIISGCSTHEQLSDRLVKEMREEPFDAVCCRNDEIAGVVMSTLQRNGWRIPDEVSVTGMDDTTSARISYPTLTSCRIQQSKIAELAVNYIDEFCIGKAAESVVLEPEFIARESVRQKLK